MRVIDENEKFILKRVSLTIILKQVLNAIILSMDYIISNLKKQQRLEKGSKC